MSTVNPQRRPKRRLLAGIVALALAVPTIGLGVMAAPAFADDAAPDPITTEEIVLTDTTDEVVEEDTSTTDEAPVATEEEGESEEAPASTLRVQPVAQLNADPLGVFGDLLPWSAPTNQASYWEDYGPHDDAQCYSHSGDSDHGSITDGGKTVTLNTFNVAGWPGDHWELLVIKGGSDWNNVIVHPTAGVAYGSPLNSGGQQSDVSHYIACKGDAPFDWNWEYAAPTCTALTVVYPEDIPSGQANDVNVRIENLLTNQELTLNFHKGSGTWSGTQVFDFTAHPNWPNWPNYKVEWVQVAGTNYHWEGTVTCGTPPPVIEQCAVPNAPTVLTDLGGMFFEDRLNPGDPTNKGTHELVDGGIAITATGGGFYSKSAGYIPVDIPFEEIGSPSLGYTVISGASAGLNLTLYKNGAWFGNLVYEPLFAKWWINKAVPGMSAGPNPGYQLAYGTPDEFLQAFVAAGWDVDAKAIGYSLGSGAVGEGLVTSLTIGCDTYLFDTAPTKFEPASPTKVDVCGVENDSFTLPGALPNELESVTTEGTYTADELPIEDGTVAVTFVPAAGYVVKDSPDAEYEIDKDGNAVWLLVFTDEVCPVEYTPGGPTKVDVCGVENDSFTLPGAKPGETESVTDEGTYTAKGDPTKGEDVIVTFTPNGSHTVEPSTDGSYEVVNGTAVWTLTYTNESCPPPPPPGLALTGSNVGPVLGLAAVLIALGALLGFGAIKRRRNAGDVA